MKLHHTQPHQTNYITAYGPGSIEVNKVVYKQSLLLNAAQIEPWEIVSFETLNTADLSNLLTFSPALILLGTGISLRFPHSSVLAPLTQQQVGVEVMDTPAACRTFNVLVAEGRQVLLAAIVE